MDKEHIKDRDRQRQKDAELARLIDLPVMCLYGTWDPECGSFSPDKPDPVFCEVKKRNNEPLDGCVPYLVLDQEKHQELMDDVIVRCYEKNSNGKLDYVSLDRLIEIADKYSYCGYFHEEYFVDLPEVLWNPETKYTGLHRGTEFCTGELSDKKWWWREIQHYSTDLNAMMEIEQLLIKHNLINDYIIQLIHITKEQPSLAAIKASAEQKVDAALSVLRNNPIR